MKTQIFNSIRTCQPALLAVFLASSALMYGRLMAQVGPVHPQTTASQAPSALMGPVATASGYRTVRSERAAMMYRRLWGIDDITLKATASGSVIRFSYRIVDAQKAAVINDKKATPYLLVEKSGARLEVPTTEKVGQLRQTAQPEDGREYWMVFQNSAHSVQPGDLVDIVIGRFRANALAVEPPQATTSPNL